MITDTSGMSAMMFGEEPGKGVDLGDAVRNAAKNVDEVISASGNDPVHAPAA
ncbi:hypothetical protein BU26DRAFT_515087 [Trematosphaeria pertusa]|uniref:Uncharacterized protein n=1 Tax=Trematosphaeria pertusa TaxID=390896 RepID=A0A6A6J0J4_9PLEO|nr:uncharacterized protein BU26DRAFT_515087 [Trematosphaeria pertusa]KAF2255370.1 hypothetical protein BU26DRAFT_515087 [Trematosphaeria pertusa]